MARRGADLNWTTEDTSKRVGAIIRILDRPPSVIATAVGVSVQSVRAWMRGDTVPSLAAQHKLETIENRMKEKGLL